VDELELRERSDARGRHAHLAARVLEDARGGVRPGQLGHGEQGAAPHRGGPLRARHRRELLPATDYAQQVYQLGPWDWMQANDKRRYPWDGFGYDIYTDQGGAA
jgi:hypothetical protein